MGKPEQTTTGGADSELTPSSPDRSLAESHARIAELVEHCSSHAELIRMVRAVEEIAAKDD